MRWFILRTRLCVQDGGTALIAAAERGHTDTIEALLELGADVNTQDKVSVCRVQYRPFSTLNVKVGVGCGVTYRMDGQR